MTEQSEGHAAATLQSLLESVPTAELLRNAYALTHRMHELARLTTPAAVRRSGSLRAQRDLIDGEVLRRTTAERGAIVPATVTCAACAAAARP